MKISTLSFLGLFLFLLAACAPATATPQPSATLPPTLTPTRTPVPSRTFAPTSTRLPTISTHPPTITPTPIPVPPLSEEGPWIYQKFIGGAHEWFSVICDRDGLNCGPVFNDPVFNNSVSIEYNLFISPRGGRFAVLDHHDQLNPVLRIIQLPDRNEVAHISIVSAAARENFNIVNGGVPQNYLAFLSATPTANFHWSPDGRYLAFAGAMDANNTDVYIFDSADNSVKRLTDEAESVQISGWSPDSQWVIYATATDFWSTAEATLLAAGAVKVDGEKIFPLYEYPEYTGRGYQIIIDWFSDDSALLSVVGYERPTDAVIVVDLSTKQSKNYISDSDFFYFGGVDIKRKIVYLRYFETMQTGPQYHEIGFYRLLLDTGEMIRLPNDVGGEWFASWDRFIRYLHDNDTQTTSYQIQDYYGNIEIEFGGILEISPDGRLVIISPEGATLLEGSDIPAKPVFVTDEELSEVRWLKDSSGFYFSKYRIGTYFCSAEHKWEPERIFFLEGFHTDELEIIYP